MGGVRGYSALVMLLVLSGSVGTSLVRPVLCLYLHGDGCLVGIMGTLILVDLSMVMVLALRELLLNLAVGLAVLKIAPM